MLLTLHDAVAQISIHSKPQGFVVVDSTAVATRNRGAVRADNCAEKHVQWRRRVDVVAPAKAVEPLARCRNDKTEIHCTGDLHE